MGADLISDLAPNFDNFGAGRAHRKWPFIQVDRERPAGRKAGVRLPQLQNSDGDLKTADADLTVRRPDARPQPGQSS